MRPHELGAATELAALLGAGAGVTCA